MTGNNEEMEEGDNEYAKSYARERKNRKDKLKKYLEMDFPHWHSEGYEYFTSVGDADHLKKIMSGWEKMWGNKYEDFKVVVGSPHAFYNRFGVAGHSHTTHGFTILRKEKINNLQKKIKGEK